MSFFTWLFMVWWEPEPGIYHWTNKDGSAGAIWCCMEPR